jgi:NAD(P)-dependent dehydrogenase (short-subunit alcohol dehydrogenase family)
MGNVFLVSGASRGLGRSIVQEALRAGHSVVAGVRRLDALHDLRQAFPDRLAVTELDVTEPDQVTEAVAATVRQFGRLDVLVNNAGYAHLASIEDADFTDFRAQLDTNLLGVVRLTRAALPLMRRQRSGHVIQVSSVGGRLATPGLGAYQTAKWAVGGFSSVLAKEVRPLGIKVTVLEPGGMRTDWAGSSMQVDPIRPEYQATVGASATMHTDPQFGANDPDKVARVVVGLTTMDEPPVRLLLGPEAYAYATAAARAQLAEDERRRELSESTVADDVSPAQLGPMTVIDAGKPSR